jgi:hypothetical protein
VICETCHGTGWNAATDLPCARCSGRGRTGTGGDTDTTAVQVVTIVLALALFAVMLANA